MQEYGELAVHRAIDYIYSNLERALTVEEIAAHCAFSKYHFNRMFRGVVGESVYSFIKRMRLERAAFCMKTSRRSISDIAVQAGYSPSNFASAFKQQYGVSATALRESDYSGSFPQVAAHLRALRKNGDSFAAIDAKMELRRIPALRLVHRRVICNYANELRQAWAEFCTELEIRYGADELGQMIGISYDDPSLTDEDRCVYDICMETERPGDLPTLQLDGGLYACYSFHDRLERMMLAFNEVFSLWLPFCRYEVAQRPGLEIYRSPIAADGTIRADLCIPLCER